MIFWDTSAIVPMLLSEPRSDDVAQLAVRDPVLVVWWATPIECLSALMRRERDATLSTQDIEIARGRLDSLRRSWTEVLASERLRSHAERLLLRHPLRAADALQLAAALTWAGGQPDDHPFATLDDRLAAVARREGFSLIIQR